MLITAFSGRKETLFLGQHISGLVISDYSFEYSHWNADRSLGEWLSQHRVPGIYDVDTRLIVIVILPGTGVFCAVLLCDTKLLRRKLRDRFMRLAIVFHDSLHSAVATTQEEMCNV